MPSDLHTYLDGTFVGLFTQTDQGALGFIYDDEYRRTRNATPMSLSMPLTRERHPNAPARAFLQGLLPDSDGRLREIADEYRVSARNPFALLSHVGRDAAGAIQLLPAGEASRDAAERTGDVRRLSTAEYADVVSDIVRNAPTWGRRQPGRWSLPGAQPKTALLRLDGQWAVPLDSTPTTHIIKPAVPPYTEHHINEFMTMAAARHLGLQVADSSLETTVNGDDVFVSKRYDRAFVGGRWTRLHQEDLGQALGVGPDRKYQSDGGPGVARIAQLFDGLRAADAEDNAYRFFEALAFNVAAVNTDAHVKNYSLMLDGDRARLAPLYDLGSHAPYPTPAGQPLTLAMSVDGEYVWDRIGENALLTAAKRLRIDADRARARVQEILHGIAPAFDQAAIETRRILGDDPAIREVSDSVAALARGRGWDSPVTVLL